MVVLFPGIKAYANEYFRSIEGQIAEGVDLLILNDNFDMNTLNSMPEATVLDMPPHFSPAEIRQVGIEYSVESGYQNIIFSDGDDFFSSDRIMESLLHLEGSEFIYNQVIPVDSNGTILSSVTPSHMRMPSSVSSVDSLLDYNFLGLSNTAVTLKFLNDFIIPGGLVAVDWYLFTILLLMGAKGRFVKNAKTYYRQTESNLVGSQQPLNKERLQVGIDVKYNHYTHVLKFCETHNLISQGEKFNTKKKQMFELKTALKDHDFTEEYINSINFSMEHIYKGWWSEILTLPEWNKI